MPNSAPLSDTSQGRRQLALDMVQILQRHGQQAYLVGGCVRDQLLGLVAKDFDVSTDATPARLNTLFPDSELVGAHFGVVLVRRSPDIHVEVATFRAEGEYGDGRRPDEVRFVTDPALDAQRRDFTINGLFLDPASGVIHDFVGGQEDLKRQVVRAIGDPVRRFREDHLRLLRAVRFAARLNFRIDDTTANAIREQAPNITKISAERVREELTRILTEGGARRGLELLEETELLRFVLPEVKAFQGVQQPPEYHPEGDVWRHVLLMLEQLDKPTATLAWGVLLHDLGKPPTFQIADRIRFNGHAEVGAKMAIQILSRLKFSNEEIEQTTALVANHMKFKDVKQMRLSTLKRFLRMPDFEEHLELHRLDCFASNGYTDAYEFIQEQLALLDDDQLRPARLIGGQDLIRAGYRPGPKFRDALEAVETAQLEGTISTSTAALALAETVLAEKSYSSVTK